MTFKINDRVKETCTSPGTGTITLQGAVAQFVPWSAGIGANNTAPYAIADQAGINWEVGIGTVGSGGTTLARTTVINSSNSGSLVNFSSGTQFVWCDLPASLAVIKDQNSNVSIAGSFNSINTFGFKNRIINGAMVIDQRNAGAAVSAIPTAANVYLCDRWAVYSSATSYKYQQNLNSVTPPAGFANYLGIACNTAYTTGSYVATLQQAIEAYNFYDFSFGTANAKTVTISFWAQSSLTGTFSGVLLNYNQTRTYPFTFSLPTANTWTYCTVTIAGDTSTTWLGATNGIGATLIFNMGASSGFLGTAGAWTSSNVYGVTGSVQLSGTTGATFYITGVQLEVGSSATSFEYRQFGQELALCQRYYTNNFVYGNAPSNSNGPDNRSTICTIFNSTNAQCAPIAFPVRMRAIPSLVFYSPSFVNTAGAWAIFPPYWGPPGISVGGGNIYDTFFVAQISGLSSVTNYASYVVSGYWTATAEL